ncbi:zinc ABC transporter ATP-binding protein, partial [Acinetobacter ursingii]
FGTQRMFYQHHHNHCGHSDHVEPCTHDPRPHIHPEPKV